MFICQDCHPETECKRCGGSDSHDFKDSFGRCEVCKKSTGCAECRHHHYCPEIRKLTDKMRDFEDREMRDVPARPDLV